jgi:SAM-dependent methyltransferase
MNQDKPITPESFEFAALDAAINYKTALLNEFGDNLNGHILEVGAGIGQTTLHLLKMPKVTKITSIEPDHKLADEFEKKSLGVKLIKGTVDDCNLKSVDTIFSVNVLEHIENDVEELSKYVELLKESRGALCLFVPARQEIYSKLDTIFGHYRRYHKETLKKKLESVGFEVKSIRYYNLIGYFLWFLNFKLLKNTTFNINAVRVFDNFIFPVVNKLETKFYQPPLGQSILVIATPRNANL